MLRPAILLLFLILALALTVRLVGGAAAVKVNAVDLAELNDVKYGLLDADNWVSQISVILDRRIDQFELTERNKPEIKRQIERVLDRLIVEIDQYQRRQNRGDGSGSIGSEDRSARGYRISSSTWTTFAAGSRSMPSRS
jgi:hypothetical protein